MKKNSAYYGAAFLMATSAIGPGFLTQTAVFSQQLMASFGFIILLSFLLDVAAQLNIWRIISISGKPAQTIGNEIFPNLGTILSILVVLGGLAFNIGNVAGAGLGLQVLTGLDLKLCSALSAAFAITIFLSKDAGKMMDYFARILGILMLLLIIYIVFVSQPPISDAIKHTFIPQKFDAKATITLVGGTVGGYITFAGAHRLLDAGITGEENLKKVNQSASIGIVLTTFFRYLLFVAALGVLLAGATLNKDNPAATIFEYSAGNLGYKIFGLVMWSAAITSVVGAAYTSVSFLKTLHPALLQNQNKIIIGFIIFSALIFILIGKPVKTLIFVGMLNGFILPIGLSIMLIAAEKKHLVGNFKNPFFLKALGWLVVVLMVYLAITSLL